MNRMTLLTLALTFAGACRDYTPPSDDTDSTADDTGSPVETDSDTTPVETDEETDTETPVETDDTIDSDTEVPTDTGCIPQFVWYVDFDRDGIGNAELPVRHECDLPTFGSGWTIYSGDCNDADPTVQSCVPADTDDSDTTPVETDEETDEPDTDTTPVETDTDDSDVDSDTDEPADTDDSDTTPVETDEETDEPDTDTDEPFCFPVYYDGDADGYGSGPAQIICSLPGPTRWMPADGDCDDTDRFVNPEALEVCNGIDDNCDEQIDGADALGAVEWWRDADGDGMGAGVPVTACDAPVGYEDDNYDCDDGNIASLSWSPATGLCFYTDCVGWGVHTSQDLTWHDGDPRDVDGDGITAGDGLWAKLSAYACGDLSSELVSGTSPSTLGASYHTEPWSRGWNYDTTTITDVTGVCAPALAAGFDFNVEWSWTSNCSLPLPQVLPTP